MTEDQFLPTDPLSLDVYSGTLIGVVIGFVLCALLVWVWRKWKGGESK